MSDELDLEAGDPSEAERILNEGQVASRSRRQSRAKSGKSTPRKAATEAEDNSLRGDAREMFDDFAKAVERRDPELAEILQRRGEAMAQGLVSLSRKVKFLRSPLVLFIAFFQPTLAFWELGSYGISKYINWRQSKVAEGDYNQAGVANVTDVTRNNVSDGYAS